MTRFTIVSLFIYAHSSSISYFKAEYCFEAASGVAARLQGMKFFLRKTSREQTS